MGYRSDVAIAYAFKRKEQVDEVLAIYRMNPLVQRHNLEEAWQVHDWNGKWGLTYAENSIKWYDRYEDVQGMEHMLQVVQDFAAERDPFIYAYRKIRIGEDEQDIDCSFDNKDPDHELIDELYDRIGLRREIETNF